ncbi:MAG: SRPBCC family protein [Gammaproteobacteria bacterium]|nr:SRPBCC family protein [Gammaproteobacteria bacterium]
MNPVAILLSTGIGAALMYLFDPERGANRRTSLREQATSASRQVSSTAGNIQQRRRGFSSSRLTDEPVSDDMLAERVRAAIARTTSFPDAINVSAQEGHIILTGPTLTNELPLLIDRVLDVRGVRDIANRLTPHTEAGSIPALQGTPSSRSGASARLSQSEWTTNARIAAGVAGGAATLYGFANRGLAPTAIGVAGLVLLGRAATNLDVGRLTGIGTRRHSVTVDKSIRIDAPIERVFDIWSNAANFPRFMTHVREVRPLTTDGGPESRRWHWQVRGSSGMEFEFDTQTTAYEKNRFLGWRTVSGALVQHEGQVRFIANTDRSTTAEIKLAYTPVAGAIGHVVAKLLGNDPKTQMDNDLQRMKTFIEAGTRPAETIGAAKSPSKSQPRAES